MRRYFLVLVLCLIFAPLCSGQDSNSIQQIKDLLKTNTVRPFNGVILISRNDSLGLFIAHGNSNSKKKSILKKEAQFFIGSLSKQITAVLVLKAFEKGQLKLNDPISVFLPDLTKSWKDSVTIHHLLNYTHGIRQKDKNLLFPVGSDFSYSGLGYEILGNILEVVSKQEYSELVTELFLENNLINTAYPYLPERNKAVQGYLRNESGELVEYEFNPLKPDIPAGGIISNAADMLLWNKKLHSKDLLQPDTYKLMVTKSADQNHSLFGKIGYGYGIRISNEDTIKEIGHTGYVPGYISMNLYYPESKTSLIVLENLDWNDEDILNTFYFEMRIRKIIRDEQLRNHKL